MATAQFNAAQQIFLCTDFNPKREGSAAHAIFQLYFKSRTVGEFLSAGGTREAILWDAKHGYIILDWEQVSAPARNGEGAAVSGASVTVIKNGKKTVKAANKTTAPAKAAKTTVKAAQTTGFAAMVSTFAKPAKEARV
jgi:hypothetical protein